MKPNSIVPSTSGAGSSASEPISTPDANTPLIFVKDLTKRYGGVVALDRMSMSVQRGTIHAIVGENGAGKSTLMKILAGVVHQDSGTIHLDHREVTIHSPQA